MIMIVPEKMEQKYVPSKDMEQMQNNVSGRLNVTKIHHTITSSTNIMEKH